MKISIGMNLQDGPFGGGNQFGKALTNQLRDAGIEVYYDLQQQDLDLILLTDPRKQLTITAYDAADIEKYLRTVNPNTLVVHRINECDERKGTTGVNQVLREANKIADHTVFVSAWLRDLHLSQGMGAHANTVILNGSDSQIYNDSGHRSWDKQEPLKVVTHHWAGNWMKGFDIYQQLDELLANEPFRSNYTFTYIGNVPDDFVFENSTLITPLSGKPLADALRQHHVYITGSQNDPGPNHQNEGANCGLPLLYRPSGGLTEYCDGYGIAFTSDNLEEKLREMAATYDEWCEKVKHYPYNAENMAKQYVALFQTLIAARETHLAERTWFQPTLWERLAQRVNQWRL